MNRVAEFKKVSFEQWSKEVAMVYCERYEILCKEEKAALENVYEEKTARVIIEDFANKKEASIVQYLKGYGEHFRYNWENLIIPKRATKGSAGHDISAPYFINIMPGETKRIPTGLRCKMDENYVMHIYPRSSMAIKHKMLISNTIPVVDSDYYYADNEGHIILYIENRGDEWLHIKEFNTFAQAVFVPFGVADTEEVKGIRTGGFGSTGR